MTAQPHLEPVGERNYVGEMRRVIDEETTGGPYESPIVAANIVRKLRVTDPDLLNGWLEAQATHFVWQAINDRDRSTRSKVRQQAERTAFRDAAEKFQAGGGRASMTQFLALPFVIADGSRCRLGDMTADDLAFVADTYERQEADAAMNKIFLRALGKKVGDGKVSDHFTEEALAAMWSSISKG
jgi:hypothetical protein